MQRVNKILGQLQGVDEATYYSTQIIAGGTSSDADTLGDLRWDGWGYSDTQFTINPDGLIELAGDRYLFSGKPMPALRQWFEDEVGLNISDHSPSQEFPKLDPPIRNNEFIQAIKNQCQQSSFSASQRLYHAHGHTSQEIYALKFGNFKRVPDMVVWPESHKQVEAIIAAASQYDVVIIPFGGGTSVSHALICPAAEKRMIVSLDMKMMNKVKWINRKNMLACVQAGVVGKALEDNLRTSGLCCGHEPDSAEFSTLGGWIATRASGMRKNKYGNIEDIVIRIKMATATGTVEKNVQVPRMSTGPDIHQMILGSEGILGVITEAVIKIRPLPECTQYGSMIFPDFKSGVACLHEIAMKQIAPVSIRLVDNKQFQFGQALKHPKTSWRHQLVDKAKKWYVLNRRKFDPEVMVAATLLFEGTRASVRAQEKEIYAVARKYGGMKAGEENGIRGYFLTYMIAYLRDFGFNYRFIAESFETSVPWDNVLLLCQNVKQQIIDDLKNYTQATPFVSCRVTQLYDSGACVYFYFGFLWGGLEDPVKIFSKIEHNARNEILKQNGSLSHHHGIGKLRRSWMEETIGTVGMKMLKGLKTSVDPNNIFGSGNLINLHPDEPHIV